MPNILTIILEASHPSLALQSQSNQTEAPKNNCYFQKLLLKIQNLHQNSNHNRAVCLARKRRPSIGPLVHWILPTQNIRPNEFAYHVKAMNKENINSIGGGQVSDVRSRIHHRRMAGSHEFYRCFFITASIIKIFKQSTEW